MDDADLVDLMARASHQAANEGKPHRIGAAWERLGADAQAEYRRQAAGALRALRGAGVMLLPKFELNTTSTDRREI